MVFLSEILYDRIDIFFLPCSSFLINFLLYGRLDSTSSSKNLYRLNETSESILAHAFQFKGVKQNQLVIPV